MDALDGCSINIHSCPLLSELDGRLTNGDSSSGSSSSSSKAGLSERQLEPWDGGTGGAGSGDELDTAVEINGGR